VVKWDGVLQEQNHHTHKPKATSMFIQGLKVYVEPLKQPWSSIKPSPTLHFYHTYELTLKHKWVTFDGNPYTIV
jgi:hypothetical protein